MKKFSIKDLNIIHKDEKINALKLENKNEKFILYSNIDKNIKENEFFNELKFKEEISITPKKKVQSLNLQIEKENDFNIIKIKDYRVFYLKDNNSVSFEKDDFKLILSNGTLYNTNKIIKLDHDDENKITKSENDNLVKNILLNNKNSKLVQESSNVVEESSKVSEESSNEVVEESSEVVEESNEVVEESNEVVEESTEVIEESNEAVEESTEAVEESSNVVEKSTEAVEESTESVEESNEAVEESTEAVEESNEAVEESNEAVEESTEAVEESNEAVEDVSDNNSETSNEKNENYVNFETFQKNIIESKQKEENNVQINKNINKEIKAKNDNELYNLDQILNDFNKYFIDEKNENKYETQEISFYNKKYNINILEIESSILNIKNLFKTTILPKNIINDNNVSIKLKNNNSSYIILYLKNPYLFNKVDSKLIITNLNNKKSIIIQNNQYFKLNNINFYIVNNCTLMIPIINKLVSNKFGQKINLFEPLI